MNFTGKRVEYRYLEPGHGERLTEIEILRDDGEWWLRTKKGFVDRHHVHSVQVPLLTDFTWVEVDHKDCGCGGVNCTSRRESS